MSAGPELLAAVGVFRELGWNDARLADALDLPLGTPEQRAIAKAGVASGEWGGFGEVGRDAWRWVSWIGVDDAMFTLFALRQGVTARRAAQLLRRGRSSIPMPVLAQAVAADPAAVVRALYPRDGGPGWLAALAVELLRRDDLAPPTGLGYLQGWANLAETALVHDGGDADAARWRFAEHVHAAVAAGVPAAGSPDAGAIAEVLAVGVEQGLLERDDAVELAFGGIDAAQRPSDRIAWLDTLARLGVTDADLLARAEALVPLLAHGDARLTERIAPILLDADDATALDALAMALTTRTKKTRRAVLERAAARARPEGAEALADEIAAQAAGTDRAVARAAETLARAWGLPLAPPPDQPEASGWWRPTPPVWEVPRFTVPHASPDALTDAAALLTGRGESSMVDVAVERFLALAVAVAHADPDAARAALRGVVPGWSSGLRSAAAWVRGEPSPVRDASDPPGPMRRADHVGDPAMAREAQAFERLGELPLLLSTPSWDDLRIDPADLVERLSRYAEAGVAASEADLLLAATRLDLNRMDGGILAAFEALPVPVRGQDGLLDLPGAPGAGPLLAGYARDPFVEPPLVRDDGWVRGGEVGTPASLAGLPARAEDPWHRCTLSVFPSWRESAWPGYGGEITGPAMAQLARSAAPLSPWHALTLLLAQRDLDDAEAAQAASDAFARGLLRPGAAEAEVLLDPPTNLAALAARLQLAAESGLASVIWPVLDAVVAASVGARRLSAGTAEVVDALAALLPEARAAVDAGLADPSVLDLPGVRALAGREGSSKAVTAARALVAALPEPTEAPVVSEPEAAPFAEAWDEGLGRRDHVPDGAGIRAWWHDPKAPSKSLMVELTVDGATYTGVKSWVYDLEVEGQCQLVGDGVTDAWLWWDGDRLAVSPVRNRTDGNHGSLRKIGATPPLTVGLTAVALTSVCHDQPGPSGDDLIRSLDARSVRDATAALLESPDFSPARVVRVLERDPAVLPVLWPVLTEAVRVASGASRPPAWLNRILDAALQHAPTLAEAGRRGLIPADAAAWPGLDELAERPGAGAALRKARELRAALA